MPCMLYGAGDYITLNDCGYFHVCGRALDCVYSRTTHLWTSWMLRYSPHWVFSGNGLPPFRPVPVVRITCFVSLQIHSRLSTVNKTAFRTCTLPLLVFLTPNLNLAYSYLFPLLLVYSTISADPPSQLHNPKTSNIQVRSCITACCIYRQTSDILKENRCWWWWLLLFVDGLLLLTI